MNPIFRLMPDDMLDRAITKLEANVRMLALADTAIGLKLREQFADALVEARRELERRRA